MIEIPDDNAECYMNGELAQEIEHLLIMRLHPLNTIAEIEKLKRLIHDEMGDVFDVGQEREVEVK